MKSGYAYKTTEEQRAYHRERYHRHKKDLNPWRDVGTLRKCTQCHQLLPRETGFNKLPHGRLGYGSECKACKIKRGRGRAPTWTGLTRAQYQTYVREGKCHICNKNKPRMAVDHCHTTKDKRGVLCPTCNTGLGAFKDDPDLLESAARYLRESRR